MTSTIEKLALRAWQEWGNEWSMFTRCSRCDQIKVCKGRRRDAVLCLRCFDEKAPS